MSQAYPLAFDEQPRGAGGPGAAEHIARVLHDSGVDVPGSLYDEALALIGDGRLGPATDRLRMLLTLDPSDGEAALLLGKVLATRGQWQESLGQLDAAAAKGAAVPAEVRFEVEAQLRRTVAEQEQGRPRSADAAAKELRSLKVDAKRLRAENAMLEQQTEELARRVRLWSSGAALVAGAAAALVMATMVFGGPGSGAAQQAGAAVANSGPAAVAAEPVTGQPSDEGDPPTPAPANVAPAMEPSEPASAPKAEPASAPKAEPASAPKAQPASAPKPAAKPAAKPAPKPAAKPAAKAAGGSVYTVAKGDTLGSIAKKVYGDANKASKIRSANSDKLKSDKSLQVGMKLKIPK
jgi:nucleoid-associated protein YgaU